MGSEFASYATTKEILIGKTVCRLFLLWRATPAKINDQKGCGTTGAGQRDE